MKFISLLCVAFLLVSCTSESQNESNARPESKAESIKNLQISEQDLPINLEICNIMQDQGLKAGAWKNFGTHYGCMTTYVDLPDMSGSFNPDNMALYLSSQSVGQLEELKLVLNIWKMNKKTASSIDFFIQMSGVFYNKLTGQTIPDKFVEAIKKGITKQYPTKDGKGLFEIINEDSGKIKTIKFIAKGLTVPLKSGLNTNN